MKNKLMWLLALVLLALGMASAALAEEQVGTIHITSSDMLAMTDKVEMAKGYFEYHGVDGTEVSGYVTAKLMGTLSIGFPKKNYNIRFYADEECTDSINVTFKEAWGAHTKYCLKANWVDVTHARNIVSSRLYAQAQAKYGLFADSPNNGQVDGFFVEVYVNGAYHGLYTLNIPKAAWLFGLDKSDDNQIAMMARSVDSQSSAAFARESPAENIIEWEIEVGPDKTQKDVSHCFDLLNRLIRFVKDSSDEEFVAQFGDYLNKDACLNYYCFMYLSSAVDNKTKNMILVTFDGEVWYPTMYDLDATWGLYFAGDGLYNVDERFPDNHITSVLWDRFAKLFGKEIDARFDELRQTVWSQENIAAAFTEFITSIPQSVYDRDREAWPELKNLQGSLEQIISYAQLRGNYAEACISQLAVEPVTASVNGVFYQLEAPYTGKEYSFVNTGVNLYQPENPNGQDYTIILQYSDNPAAAESAQMETVLSHVDINGNGLFVETAQANYSMFYAGPHKYEALYHYYPKVRSLVIVKSQDGYTFYADDVNNVRYIQDAAMSIGLETNLILGAYAYAAPDGGTTFTRSFTGTVHRFEIRDTALTAEEAAQLLQEMAAAAGWQ